MLLSEDGLKVVRIDCSIASIRPFRINVLLSSKSIQFDAKITRMESDNKVELEEVLRQLCLSPDQHLGSKKYSRFL